MTHRICFSFFMAFATITCSATATGQETSDTELVYGYASRHQIVDANQPSRRFKLRTAPVQSWSNPTRGNVVGAVFLWTDGARPVATGGIFVWREKTGNLLSREFHSLSDHRLVGRFDGTPIWSPTRPGIEFKVIPRAAKPAAGAATRLRQMKRLASRFAVTISKTDERPEKTRLLPTPVYRYASKNDGIIEGSVFTFVQGTDPEALLLIEARPSGSATKWHFAMARCTSWSVLGKLDEQVVYNVPQYDFSRRDRSAAFLNLPQLAIE